MSVSTELTEEILLRKPAVEDAASVWQLVRDTGILDLNSPYSYLMMFKYFPETCALAEDAGGNLAGFVTGFLLPTQPDTLFIWQVAVADPHRNRGVGWRMIRSILGRPACRLVRNLEATVTPSNRASAALFRKVARKLGTTCKVADGFSRDLFPGAVHEPEQLYHIGPFTAAGQEEGVLVDEGPREIFRWV